MKRILVRLIGSTGRFFVLSMVPFCLIITIGWLNLLDISPWLFLLLSFIVIPVFVISFALLVGVLFSGAKPPVGIGVTREVSPELWDMAEEVFGKRDAAKLKIFLSNEFNASIQVSRRWLGMFGEVVVLDLGIPVLCGLDLPALRAVMEHEKGHREHKDINGSRNIYEFYNTFEVLHDFAPPGETVTGTVIFFLLWDLDEVLKAEANKLSREAELLADNYSARDGQAVAIARALYLLKVCDAYMIEKIYKPLEDEILRSMTIPESPVRRFIANGTQELTGDNLPKYWAMTTEPIPEDEMTHPHTHERLAALGFVEVPEFSAVDMPAWTQVFTDEMQESILVESDRIWERGIAHIYE